MCEFLDRLQQKVPKAESTIETIPLRLTEWVCLLNFSQKTDNDYKNYWLSKLLKEGDHFVNVSGAALFGQITVARENVKLHLI